MTDSAVPIRGFQSGEALHTRAQLVDGWLRQAILSGELAPGEKIRPNELAAKWGVSPTPLREALLRLEGDGLIESIPQRGARVTLLTRDSLNELYELRLLLEPVALRKSMANPEKVDAERVIAAHTAMTAAIGGDDLVLADRLHRDFHRSLYEACGSSMLLALTDTMSMHSARYRLLTAEPRGGWAAVEKEHDDLVAAFLANDTDEAVSQLEAHITRTLDFLPALPESES
jgi:GntR family carbon starvation induced transcriptional regulator